MFINQGDKMTFIFKVKENRNIDSLCGLTASKGKGINHISTALTAKFKTKGISSDAKQDLTRRMGKVYAEWLEEVTPGKNLM